MQPAPRRRTAAGVAGVLALALVVMPACSSGDDDDDEVDVTLPRAQAECEARSPVLRVDLIETAIEQVEAELGGPQQYFEINATDLLVNLFVSVEDGTQVKPYVFIEDELNSRDPLDGTPQGFTFAASAVEFDAQKVTSCVTAQLPESQATAFEIVADAQGNPMYSVVTTSAQGGQLIVAVNGQGQVLSVDPA
ncbi:MAG: hypothetical protein HZB15_07990 [Actinobacteria bacterium]|nr:hypothetical protein [Actinomycetota bacterium]